jgi:hypothetical protein
LFSIAPLLDVQLKNIGVMLLKFRSDTLLIINPFFVSHSWMGLGPIL